MSQMIGLFTSLHWALRLISRDVGHPFFIVQVSREQGGYPENRAALGAQPIEND